MPKLFIAVLENLQRPGALVLMGDYKYLRASGNLELLEEMLQQPSIPGHLVLLIKKKKPYI